MSGNTRFLKNLPDDSSRVFKVRRLSDQKFKQIFSATESNTDEDRWGHHNDRVWLQREDAEKQAGKERFPCEAVTFILIEES